VLFTASTFKYAITVNWAMKNKESKIVDMGKCFVIQPFDEKQFDKRFRDHFEPAIIAADLEPYRVDRDPSVRVPIDSIHSEIKNADVCLADITTNNPNVWYELGYALARHKEVVIVCSKERRDEFPFDIQHLNIIRYDIASGSDFKKLELDITAHLKARILDQQKLKVIASISPAEDVMGLTPHEIAALTILLSKRDTPTSSIWPLFFIEEMEKNTNFNLLGINLSIQSLIEKEMAQIVEGEDSNGYPADMYKIEQKGMRWLLDNQDKLTLRNETKVFVDKPKVESDVIATT
jgi:hypothetical protein